MKKFIYALASVAMLGCMSANAIDWTEEGLNIAMGKTSWCSTGDAKAGNDGNVGSRWESQHFAPQWWAVDLCEEKDLDRIEIKWEGALSAYRLHKACSPLWYQLLGVLCKREDR